MAVVRKHFLKENRSMDQSDKSTGVSLRETNIKRVEEFLRTKGLSFDGALEATAWSRLLLKKGSRSDLALRFIGRYFSKISWKDIAANKALPDEKEWGFERKNEKIRVLSVWLKENRGIELWHAISVSESTIKRSVEGCVIPSNHLLKMIADYFFLDQEILTNDELELPTPDKITVDEDLIAIQKKDYLARAEQNKHRHVIRRSWRILSKRQRINLVISCVLIVVPLLAFTGYCAYTVMENRFTTIKKYNDDDMSADSKKIESSLAAKEDAATVKLGSQIMSISSIGSSSYDIRLSVWFDFDQLQFHRMMCTFNSAVNYYDVQEFGTLSDRWTNADRYLDRFGWDKHAGAFLNEPNGVPDFIEASDFKSYPAGNDKAAQRTFLSTLKISDIYTIETESYPASTVSNNYPNKTPMWSVSKGVFVSDSFNYDFQAPYYKKITAGTGTDSFRLFQKCTFSATILKSFDCPRYPLDSEEFNVFLTPKYTTDVLRYEIADNISLRSVQQEGTAVYVLSTYGTAEQLDYESGISPYFNISNGYSVLNNSSYIRSNVRRLSYTGVAINDTSYKDTVSSYEIVLRVNRLGFNLFLQAFANLFAVIVWITIAFYDQSYNGEDAIGMLGTGLFGVISSVLIGISMISDANLFSLITMINIFTLCVIMLMAYEAIASKRSKIAKDLVGNAYNIVKLRILFVVLLICTLTMFVGLPVLSYITF
jgi:hypothetical protein